MNLLERKELDYVRAVASHWYKQNSASEDPDAQKRAMEWEAVLLAENLEDISKALDQVALGIAETNEQEQGEANG